MMKVHTNSVFILWHIRRDDEYGDDAKLIGVYRTNDDCLAAVERLKGKSGFRDYVEGFDINEYTIGKDNWTEGFVGSERNVDGLENSD